jgi:outer membrane receptor protein involved in Fe transport
MSARQALTGNIKDKETTKPIEAATIELLLLPDSLVTETAKTNSDGFFTLYRSDTSKVYCLRITHVSYKKLLWPVVKRSGTMINNQGIINLEPKIYNFKEVVVNGSKVRVTELPDRTVYGMPDDLKKSSTDGLDILRKVPSIQVDYFNEEITVDGKSNIKIEVDGVTRDKEFLKKLHPSQIDKLEVITSPSGKYDAEVDAVINVITNPQLRFGLKGMFNSQLLPYSTDTYMGRLSGNLDYGLNKISYYIALNASAFKFDFINDMQRVSGSSSLQRNSTQGSQNRSGNVNVGIIANPNDYNNINMNVSFNGNTFKGDGNVFNYNSQNNNLSRIYQTISNSENNNRGLNSSLFYKHKFDKNTQHGYEVEMTYYKSLKAQSTTLYQNIEYALDTTELSRGALQSEENSTNRQTFNTQANYTLPFDSVYTFNTGINGNYNQYKIDNISTVTTSPGLDYKELRGGGFAELSRTFKKGSIKVGSRVETTKVIISSSNTSHYVSVLPYTNGQYKINSKNNIKLSYSRRVIRPSSRQLNPFVSVVDSQTISRGNINLKPAYRDNFQLTYNLKLGGKKITVNLSPQTFFEYKTKLIQTITRKDSNTYVSAPENISNGYVAGGGLSLNAQIFMVMLNSNFRYSYNHIDSYQQQINAINKKTWNWNSNLVCPLPFNFRFFSMLNLNGPSVNGQEITKSSPFYIVGLIKQFKNNSSLNVLVFNPFAKKFFDNKTTLNSSSFYQSTESYMNVKNAIIINYTYSFKIGKDINLQKREAEQMEDNINKLPF